jgi:hypothetical protein
MDYFVAVGLALNASCRWFYDKRKQCNGSDV